MDILGKWVLKAPKLSEPFADVLDDKLWVVAMSQTDEAEITTTIVDANRRGLFYDVIALRGCYGGVPIFRWILDFRFKTIMAKNQWSNYFIPKITFKFAFKSH